MFSPATNIYLPTAPKIKTCRENSRLFKPHRRFIFQTFSLFITKLLQRNICLFTIVISRNKILNICNNFYNPIFNTEYVFDKLQIRPTCIMMTFLWLSQLLYIYIRVELFIVMKKDNV